MTISLLTSLLFLGFQPGDMLQAVDIHQVKVQGELGRRLEVTLNNNLLVIDLEGAFLKPFLERNAGDGYIGLGKTIDALARFSAYTGDERIIARKKKLVDTLLKTQESDGYLGMLKKESRIKKLWDVHELSYLVYGLTSDARFCGEAASLKAAQQLADYLMAQWDAGAPVTGPDDISAIMSTTGLDCAMLYLYQQTKEVKYRDFVVEKRRLPEWEMPIVQGRWGKVEGHVYAYTAKCLEQIRLSQSAPDKRLWNATEKTLNFLLNEDGMAVTGNAGDHECFHDTQSGTTNLGETCTVAYLLRWYDELIRMTEQPGFGDLMERAMYNALFAAQSPDGRQIRYYTPFEAPRSYFKDDTYCCPCNYRRILVELPGMVYYHKDTTVFVNLYMPSQAALQLDNGATLNLRQETDYPNSGAVKLLVEKSSAQTPCTLALRKPAWAASASLRVNGETVTPETSKTGWLTLTRAWKAGDVVEADFPMEWRPVQGRKAQSGRVALLRGPMIFAYNPALNPEMNNAEQRLLTLDVAAPVEGPFPDKTVRPDGMACKVPVWGPGVWYPHAKPQTVTLTEFADPGITGTYFLVPNPKDERMVKDELVGQHVLPFSGH